MGLAASSPDWEAEFNTINKDLDQIITLLAEANAELSSIDSLLSVVNCSIQQTSLQEYIGYIKTEYIEYQTLLGTAASGDTAGQYAQFSAFANVVRHGTGPQLSIAASLNIIQSNFEKGTGSVIISCLGPIPKPANGTFRGDSIYYVQAQGIMNQYYYWTTIALGLISEAYHWDAWIAAGGPGGTTYSADSIQEVCDNPNAGDDCLYVINQTNSLYNDLLEQFKLVGAPYTGEDLLFQKNTNGEYCLGQIDRRLHSSIRC